MLAVSSLRETTTSKDEIHIQVDDSGNKEFLDFSDENLLGSIDFNDLFAGINEGDKLPDLEIDPELLAEFSVSSTSSEGSEKYVCEFNGRAEDDNTRNESNRVSSLGSRDETNRVGGGGGDNISKHEESVAVNCQQPKDCEKGKKSSGACVKSNNQGKKKMKVDWTPDLHRRFVQAVEQLGVDKAVPSRILEVMGIDCLTRHNIASHLQKYRSHKKHLLVREAASWSQRRQTYGAGDGSSKRIMAHWVAPTMGFPPMPNLHHHFRPLHVWGHPRMDTKPLMLMWPKHHSHSPPPLPPTWATPTPILPSDPNSYWNHHHQLVLNGLTPGTPCYPQPLAPPTRFATPPVPGIPPHAIGLTTGQSGPHHLLDFHPSKESIDAAIGDALSKPWQPLPIGLKPPSTDSVLVELQRQGIAKVPPSCA